MGKTNQTKIKEAKIDQGVLLLDHYDESAEMLKDSFRRSGFKGPVIVLADNGFLPEDVISLYRWFMEDQERVELPGAVSYPETKNEEAVREYRLTHAGFQPGKARFFNQIELPDYWEISGTAQSGEIHDLQHLKGRIFYGGTAGQRLVSDVDWLDETGNVRCTDHYDGEGLLYARTIFNQKGERFCKSWFDPSGRERIVENYVTGDLTVNRNGQVQFFRNSTELAIKMLQEIGAEGERIFYNSLSTPLFVTHRLRAPEKGNVLFWQEGPREDIPGNMQMIFQGDSRTSMVCVQNRKSYEKLLELGAPEEMVTPFGFVYDFKKKPEENQEVLICTNSDQIEGLKTLVERFPELTFHIAAVTEMSATLLSYGNYPNVRLYPTVKSTIVEELFGKCDLYLDINHGTEILSSVKQAFLHRQLILGVRGTLHRSRYMAEEDIFEDIESLVTALEQIVKDPAERKHRLKLQEQAALSEPKSAYKELF